MRHYTSTHLPTKAVRRWGELDSRLRRVDMAKLLNYLEQRIDYEPFFRSHLRREMGLEGRCWRWNGRGAFQDTTPMVLISDVTGRQLRVPTARLLWYLRYHTVPGFDPPTASRIVASCHSAANLQYISAAQSRRECCVNPQHNGPGAKYASLNGRALSVFSRPLEALTKGQIEFLNAPSSVRELFRDRLVDDV